SPQASKPSCAMRSATPSRPRRRRRPHLRPPRSLRRRRRRRSRLRRPRLRPTRRQYPSRRPHQSSRGSSRPRARPPPEVGRIFRRGAKSRPTVHDRMTLAEHLGELRRRLIVCLVAIAIGGVVAFIFYPEILNWLTGPYRDVCAAKHLTCPGKLVITDPLEGFAVRMKVTGYGGVVLALPVILWQIWGFVTPGLYENEKRYAIPFVFAAVALFIMGALIALWTFPKALQFLISFSGDVQPLFAP